MMAANNNDSGKPKGTMVGAQNERNLIMVKKSKSLPANSAMKSQIPCKTNIKNKITNTEVNVIMKDLIMYLSNIFTRTKLV